MILLSHIKRTLNKTAATALYLTGITQLLISSRLKQKLIVLMYHRVIPKKDIPGCPSHPGIIVSREAFARHMAFVGQRLHPVSITDLAQSVENRTPLKDKSCLVTFDDGWKDNYDHAFPILKEFNIPAVIFIPTDFVGRSTGFWQEKLFMLLMDLHEAMDSAGNNEHFLDKLPFEKDIRRIMEGDSSEIKDRAFSFISGIKNKSRKERDDLIWALQNKLGQTPGDSRPSDHRAFLDWEEIKTMEKQNVSFGSHGKSHAILTAVPEEEVFDEVKASRQKMHVQLGAPPLALAYPNGDCNSLVQKQVEKADYKLAFTTFPGLFAVSDDPLLIPRINIHEDMTGSLPLFAGKLARLW